MSNSPIHPSPHALRTAARYLLTAILLFAASLKGWQLITERVVSTGFLNSRPFQSFAVIVETFLGLWLVSGWFPAAAGRVACLAFAVFAGVAGWKLAGGEPSCGCFGKLMVKPWQSFVLDLLAIPMALMIGMDPRRRAASAASRCPDPRDSHPGPSRRALVGATSVLLLLACGGFVKLAFFGPAGRPDVRKVVLDPAKWKGKDWPLGEYIDIWPRLSQGNWAVLFYSPDCEECQPTVRAYANLANEWKAKGGPAQIALVATTDSPPGDDFPDLGRSEATKGRVDVPDNVHWFIPPPTLVILRDGEVLVAIDGEGHCDWDDRKFKKW